MNEMFSINSVWFITSFSNPLNPDKCSGKKLFATEIAYNVIEVVNKSAINIFIFSVLGTCFFTIDIENIFPKTTGAAKMELYITGAEITGKVPARILVALFQSIIPMNKIVISKVKFSTFDPMRTHKLPKRKPTKQSETKCFPIKIRSIAIKTARGILNGVNAAITVIPIVCLDGKAAIDVVGDEKTCSYVPGLLRLTTYLPIDEKSA